MMTGDDRDAIHDLRVSTRRLQEAFSVLGTLDDEHTVERWRRTLRRIRRALGMWRNLDVVLAEVKRRRRGTRSEKRREAWTTFRAELERMRVNETVRARKRLRRADLEALHKDASTWISTLDDRDPPLPVNGTVGRRLEASWRHWQQTLADAGRLGTVAAVHALRVATKRLRYRCEVAAEIEPESARAALSWTRDLQERLGDWHDRQVLHELVARVLEQPDFLLQQLRVSESLLAEIARERRIAPEPTSQLPDEASLAAGRSAVESLLERTGKIAEPVP